MEISRCRAKSFVFINLAAPPWRRLLAAVALTAVEPSLGSRRVRAGREGPVGATATSAATDFTPGVAITVAAGWRCRGSRPLRHVGTGIAIAASQNRARLLLRRRPGLLRRWAYYGGDPYYGSQPYYGG